jgi:superfamily II DNA or RNA helicase
MEASIPVNARVMHRKSPELGFGVVRYVEEDALGDLRLQIAFDHLDELRIVAPEDVELVEDALVAAQAGHWGDPEAVRRKLAVGLVIGENNVTGVFTKAAVRPLPHQVYLLDRVVSGNRFGHVLADDVGLGKTIEAGLIITSLLRREPPQRILIVCPAGLALQWQDELDDHFNLHFKVLGSDLDGRRVTAWRGEPFVIAPIDRLKREDYRAILEQVGSFDLVVCDEAHRLNAGPHSFTKEITKTANYRLFEFLLERRLIRFVDKPDLTPRSPRLLLLSGTPHQGNDDRFLRLLHLARPDLFDPDGPPAAKQLVRETLTEALTRTPKSRAVDWEGQKLFRGHDSRTLEVPWTPEELELSRRLTQYILRSLQGSGIDDRAFQLVIELVMHTFHKIAASSWAALSSALERRLEALRGQPAAFEAVVTEDEDDGEGAPAFATGDGGRTFFADEVPILEGLISSLNRLVGDSKWRETERLLAQIETAEAGAKVLFFTQYRATQQFLRQRLLALFPGVQVELVHGEVSPEDRREARRRFETSSRFLVSTEAGGEGVNLQKACHVMVNYDLPWNPMRLQQRIGRLDRYGQRRRVQVFNLRVPDSWDARISLRIQERLEVIQRTMGEAGLDEDYREMLLGQVAEQMDVPSLFRESVAGRDVPDAQVDSWIEKARRSVERLDSLLGQSGPTAEDAVRLKPTLTPEDFRFAFAKACEKHGLRLSESRNSANKFVPEVFNFTLPQAFRDPIFRPSRTCHVVFDRGVFHQVRDEDLGRVRGQAIRPVLAGFGEPVTDWLFQSACEASAQESTAVLLPPAAWKHGSGWLLVYALRWLGTARRLQAPDLLCGALCPPDGVPLSVPNADLAQLVREGVPAEAGSMAGPSMDTVLAARKLAQERLRELIGRREGSARSTAGLSLLMVIAVGT